MCYKFLTNDDGLLSGVEAAVSGKARSNYIMRTQTAIEFIGNLNV